MPWPTPMVMMAPPNKRRDTMARKGAGRPSKYQADYPERMIEHFRKGLTFSSFAAVIHVSLFTLSRWVKKYPEFRDAKENFEKPYLELFYLKAGQAIMMGQVKTPVRETPMLDRHGVIRRDADGEVMYQKEYSQARTNAAVWIFTMKNIMGWHDQRNITLKGDNSSPNLMIDMGRLTTLEIENRYNELMDKALPDKT